jgi:hypothetical protein
MMAARCCHQSGFVRARETSGQIRLVQKPVEPAAKKKAR